MQIKSFVNAIHQSLNAKDRRLHSLILSILVASIVGLALYPMMNRSLWVDEAMLFRNYPIENIEAIFSPLRYYDQAATPLYSLFASLIASLDIAIGRYISTIFIISSVVWLLILNQSSLIILSIALLSVFAFFNPLLMYSEFKHYGFEVIGVAISIRWFLFKKNTNELNAKDLFYLTSSLIFGISTLITSAVAICVFLLTKYFNEKRLKRNDFIYFVCFLCVAIAYYLLIKRVTVFQIENYVDAYNNKGIFGNLKALLGGGYGVVGKGGLAVLFIATVLLIIAPKDFRIQRLLLLSVVTALAFMTASALGLYPATNARHMNWSAGFYVAIVFYGLKGNVYSKGFSKLLTISLIALLVVVTTLNFLKVYRNGAENTENNLAISFIRSIPPSSVGLWIGGQPVIEYYKKIYPDLSKHSYVGLINVESEMVDIKNQSPILDDYSFSELKRAKGAWGKMVMFRIINDYSIPARALLKELSHRKAFYILASHYDIQAKTGYSKMRVIALHEEMKKENCSFIVVKQLANVSVYRVTCV
ncbi:MAG: hypothetical protein K0A92_10545 [Methyloprofundus sp.]|nr:hypothetical protein [Methyloprofundus sp.]